LPTGGSYKVYQGLSAGPPAAAGKAQHTTMMVAPYSGVKIRKGLSLVLQHPPSPSQSYPWQLVSHEGPELLPWAALNDECRNKNKR